MESSVEVLKSPPSRYPSQSSEIYKKFSSIKKSKKSPLPSTTGNTASNVTSPKNGRTFSKSKKSPRRPSTSRSQSAKRGEEKSFLQFNNDKIFKVRSPANMMSSYQNGNLQKFKPSKRVSIDAKSIEKSYYKENSKSRDSQTPDEFSESLD